MTATPMEQTKPTDVVEIHSHYGIDETLQRLESEITGREMEIFARIDHAATATAANLAMEPATVVIFGNARGGTPLMVKSPGLALDLPLRILVRQDQDDVVVSYHEPVAFVSTYGLAASDAVRLQALSTMARAAAGALDDSC